MAAAVPPPDRAAMAERWARVDALFHAALDRAPDERDAVPATRVRRRHRRSSPKSNRSCDPTRLRASTRSSSGPAWSRRPGSENEAAEADRLSQGAHRAAAFPLRHHRSSRRRRHGRGVPCEGSSARPAGRHQDPAAGARRRSAPPRTLPPGSPRRFGADASQCRGDLRARGGRGPAVHRHGTRRRADARCAPRATGR